MKKTVDLFTQNRGTVEVLDDASPDHTPRQGFSKTSATYDNKHAQAISEQEEGAREQSFTLEKTRMSNYADRFVPAPGITSDDVSKERQRIQDIEESARLKQKSYDKEIRSRKIFLEKDKSAVKIQAVFRGYLGRLKYALEKRLNEIIDNSYTNDWIEVRDRDSGDIWYYNQTSGESRWDRPAEMYQTLSTKSTMKHINTNTVENHFQGLNAKYLSKKTRNMLKSETLEDSLLPNFNQDQSTSMEQQRMNEEKSAKHEIDKALGVVALGNSDTLIAPDGRFIPQLRNTIMDALLETRFDSVSSVLADERWMQSEKDPFSKSKSAKFSTTDRADPFRKPMIANFSLDLEKKEKKAVIEAQRTSTQARTSPQKGSSTTIQDLTLKSFNHHGFEEEKDIQASGMGTLDEYGQETAAFDKENICFGCWSAGRNRSCALHETKDKLRPSQTMLLCRNWDLSVMQRRYRSEEIQEIFMKKTSSLRYDSKRKKFSTIEEMKHIIYRFLNVLVEKYNLKMNLIVKAKRWMLSYVEEFRAGHVKALKSTVIEKARVMRLRRSLWNNAQVSKFSMEKQEEFPLPPITGYSWPERLKEEQYLFTVPDPSSGENVEMIIIYPIPVPRYLYQPRVYHRHVPKTIPMPKPEYLDYSDDPSKKGMEGVGGNVIPANHFIDDMNPAAWMERIVATYCRDVVHAARQQVSAITPVAGLEQIRRTKQPPPCSIKFATLGRKPRPQMMDIGGLPAELLIYQLITTFVPSQYGSLMVMDKASISPGVSPEISITFESILTPPVRPQYVLRPVEHPLNYRRAPTVGIHSKIDENILSFYGINRPEQTGEQESHGFRTSTFGQHLLVYEETDPQAFTPSALIASLNHSASNKSFTTHADFTYPFCEPSTRDNSTLDFYHLLLEGVVSGPKSQVFTALSVQEPGFFLKEGKDDLPMGHLVVSVYRSWAFTQRDHIEEFKTDDGVTYWYHRKTGQTFWERPLFEDEEASALQGGTILDMDHPEEPLNVHAGENDLKRRYLQGDFRKLMLVHHETDKEAARRRQATAVSARMGHERGIFPDPNAPNMAEPERVQVPKLDFQASSQQQQQQQQHGGGALGTRPSTSASASSAVSLSSDLSSPSRIGTTSSQPFPVINTNPNSNNNNNNHHPNNNATSYVTPSPSRPATNASQPPYSAGGMGNVGAMIPGLSSSLPPMSMSMPMPMPVISEANPMGDAISHVVPGMNVNVMAEISQNISKMLAAVMNQGNPEEMIQLGLGMGMAMMQGANLSGYVDTLMPSHGNEDDGRSTASSSSYRNRAGGPRGLSGDIGDADQQSGVFPSVTEDVVTRSQKSGQSLASLSQQDDGKEPIGVPYATKKFSAENKLDHNEEMQQKEFLSSKTNVTLTSEDIARKITTVEVDPTLTPDEAPPKMLTVELPKNAEEKMKKDIPVLVYPQLSTCLSSGLPPQESITHPVAGLGTSFVLEREGEFQEMVPNSVDPLRRVVMPLPVGFFNAIVAKHIAKQEVDYLPQVPNLPQTRNVGRVRPRSTALDWLSISFDPWSAGKNPLGVEFVNSLSSKADKLFEGGAAKALEAMDALRQATVADAFATVEDLEGLAKQRNDISKAQVLAKDFKMACTLCRHNKYSELEELINQPEWSVPIDYQDELGNSLLHVAAQNGNKRLVKLCLRRGAQLNLQNLHGQTALHYAYGYGYDECGDYLVKRGADDSIRNKDGLTCYEGLGARELALL